MYTSLHLLSSGTETSNEHVHLLSSGTESVCRSYRSAAGTDDAGRVPDGGGECEGQERGGTSGQSPPPPSPPPPTTIFQILFPVTRVRVVFVITFSVYPVKKKIFFRGFFFVLYSTLLHLPPLRVHSADGCWDRTRDRCNWCIGSQTL
jgi:hypothetical protein